MVPPVLFVCGLFLTAYGLWRGWTNGRSMLAPGAGRAQAPELRLAAWRLALAVGWLMIAMLGLLMATVASSAG
ncbi:MAG TPA: hypothetical protein VFW86_06580 [Candidatus Limnocylindrales bacterium]|nr:hypothetical protein [Candidatus Limnocylindrales bacterium]